jgi:putative transposase
VVLEDLRVKEMNASSKGSVEALGRNVCQKAGLNKSMLDLTKCWHEFRRQLAYKLAWAEGGCFCWCRRTIPRRPARMAAVI